MLRFLLDTGIADFLFDWNPMVLLLSGIVVDVIFFALAYFLGGEEKYKKIVASSMIIIIIFAVVLSVLTEFVSARCTRVPLFDENNIPYSQAALILRQDSGLRCVVVFDDIAQEKQDEGVDTSSYSFYITSCSPAPGTLVEQNTEVVLFVSWRAKDSSSTPSPTPSLSPSPILPPSLAPIPFEENNDRPFQDFDPSSIYHYNSNEFTLTVNELGGRIITEGNRILSLGNVPSTNANALLQIDLVDFNSEKTIDSKRAHFGDTVLFTDIPDGTYYYKVTCEGYKAGYPESPFGLNYNSLETKSILSWSTCIMKEDTVFGQGFKVRMLSSSEIVPFTEVTISVMTKNGDMGSYNFVHINEEGFLAMLEGYDEYSVGDFYLAEGYSLVVYNHDNKPIEAYPDNTGICTLQY